MNYSRILIILSLIATSQSGWIEGTTRLPRSDSDMAIGYFDQSIYIIGGLWNKQQLVEFNVLNQQFTDFGSNNISGEVWGISQFFIQSNDYLYIIDFDEQQLQVYDLANKVLINFWQNVIIPIDVDRAACITTANNYIFIAGGDRGLNNYLYDFQILNISSLEWIDSVPSMQDRKGRHACIIYEQTNTLYTIGGFTNGPNFLNTIDTFFIGDINNVQQYDWTYNTDNLIFPTGAAYAVLYKENIWIIGGFDGTTSNFLNDVQIINPISGAVSLLGEKLAYNVAASPAINVNDILYTFGGLTTLNAVTDKWQYYISPTNSPTSEPTFEPTVEPTIKQKSATGRSWNVKSLHTFSFYVVAMLWVLS